MSTYNKLPKHARVTRAGWKEARIEHAEHERQRERQRQAREAQRQQERAVREAQRQEEQTRAQAERRRLCQLRCFEADQRARQEAERQAYLQRCISRRIHFTPMSDTDPLCQCARCDHRRHIAWLGP